MPTVLHIETQFSLNDVDTDPLTKLVFEAIQEKEVEDKQSLRLLKKPNNYLTTETRYFWLEKNDNGKPVIKIKAKLVNKKEILAIVNAHE